MRIKGDFWGKSSIFYYIINQKLNNFIKHHSPPWYKTPLIPKVRIHITHFLCEWRLVSRGEWCCRGKKLKCACHRQWYLYIKWRKICHLRNYILMEIDHMIFFLWPKHHFCWKHAFLWNLSRLCTFLFKTKRQTCSMHPCSTLLLFVTISLLLIGFLVPGYLAFQYKNIILCRRTNPTSNICQKIECHSYHSRNNCNWCEGKKRGKS